MPELKHAVPTHSTRPREPTAFHRRRPYQPSDAPRGDRVESAKRTFATRSWTGRSGTSMRLNNS